MYTKSALRSLYPYLPDIAFEKVSQEYNYADRSKLYGEVLDKISNFLVRDPATGHIDNIVNYVLSNSSASKDVVSSLLVKKVAQKSPKLSDEEMLSLLIPKNVQEPGEIAQFRSTLENYLQSVIDSEHSPEPTPEPTPEPFPEPNPEPTPEPTPSK